jgi:glycosyltransferase involved in cell wall biosynthesis
MAVAISIIIPIKNEASNLPRCLASVRWADEIWVIDSRSADGSVAIVTAEGNLRTGTGLGSTHFVQFEFSGTWPKKKNWALENLPLKNTWAFILDADEELPPEAEVEIDLIVRDSNHPFDGYWINRRFMFMGKWLKYAYYPNWNLRLFRHRLGRYEKLTDIDTASGDNEVHEHVIVKGKTARLQSEINHYAFPSVDIFVEKHNRYSNWEARVLAANQRSRSASALQSSSVGWRRRLKTWSRHLPFRPSLRFAYVYIWQRGFLDGREGYYFARLHATYELLCLAKEWELKKGSVRID